MFVSKRYHNLIVENLNLLLNNLKYSHASEIKSLNSQISDLRKLVFPERAASETTKEAREFDAVISASEKPPEMSEEELSKILAGSREMDLLISGNYDQDLLN